LDEDAGVVAVADVVAVAVFPLPTKAMPSSTTERKIVLEPTTELFAATQMPT
jgi:hypothetical protein